MKKCTLSDVMFYSMDGHNATYAIVRLTLDQTINKEVMAEAFAHACKRFPYFQTRLQALDAGYALVPNEKTPVVHEDPLDYVIDASENDGFLYRFSVWEDTITFSMFHGLSDGAGAMAFLKVVLADYYERLGETVVPPVDLYAIDGTPDPEETAEPLDAIPADIRSEANYGDPCFHFPEQVDPKRTCNTSYTFSADAASIMQNAASLDGSPNAIAAVIMAKAVRDLYPEALAAGIDIAITINAKAVIGMPKSHWPFLQTSTFHFDEKRLGMDEELLHTSVRGKVFADCTEERLYPAMAGVRSLGAIFEYIRDDRARKLLCLKSTETQRATATVSYAGASDFGSIGAHITGLYSFCESAAPILEINYNAGTFYLSVSSQIDSKAYAERIREYFAQLGCTCSDLRAVSFALAQGKKDKPKFGLNMATLHLITGIRAYKKGLGKQA